MRRGGQKGCDLPPGEPDHCRALDVARLASGGSNVGNKALWIKAVGTLNSQAVGDLRLHYLTGEYTKS